jgi:hypothetical protein
MGKNSHFASYQTESKDESIPGRVRWICGGQRERGIVRGLQRRDIVRARHPRIGVTSEPRNDTVGETTRCDYQRDLVTFAQLIEITKRFTPTRSRTGDGHVPDVSWE